MMMSVRGKISVVTIVPTLTVVITAAVMKAMRPKDVNVKVRS